MTVVELLMQAFAYKLFLTLGVFIPLIVVNCIVLGRAEAFASKNNMVMSLADGLGIGIGFTLSLGAVGCGSRDSGDRHLFWQCAVRCLFPSVCLHGSGPGCLHLPGADALPHEYGRE